MELYTPGFNALAGALDVLSAKHAVIASNIANIDTPGYKAKKLDFKKALAGSIAGNSIAMKRSSGKHLRGSAVAGSPSAFVENQVNNSTRNDGNNVNIDKEMTELAQNSIMYEMATSMIGKRFEGLKYAISEGRRS